MRRRRAIALVLYSLWVVPGVLAVSLGSFDLVGRARSGGTSDEWTCAIQ